MTFSYTGPANSNGDTVRFLSRDTISPGHNSDEEIAWLLTQDSNVYLAAANAARQIAAKMGGTNGGHKSVGSLSIGGGSERAKEFASLARHLEVEASRRTLTTPMISTGSTVADKETHADDGVSTPPAFSRGMHDITGGSSDQFSEVTERGDD